MKIFISRDIAPEGYFCQILAPTQAQIVGYSLIDLTEIVINQAPDAKCLFFYSQNAVDYFIKQCQKPLSGYKFACLGAATAQRLEFYGIKPAFVGTGQADSTATELIKWVKNQAICFVQAQNSLQSVQQLVEKELNSSNLIIYKNTKKTEFENPQADILAFTSPLNVEAYTNKYPILPKQKVVAIGETTAQKCAEKQIDSLYTAEKPTEKHIAEKILQILIKK